MIYLLGFIAFFLVGALWLNYELNNTLSEE